MKGELIKLAKGWTVLHKIYDEGINFGVDYPLHPDDAAKFEPATLGSFGEVEYEIIDEFTHPELYQGVGWGDGIQYAKLIQKEHTPKIYESPDGGETIYERTAGDYTKKLKPKYTQGKGISFYLSQDQFREMEVEKIANEQYENVGDEKLFPNHTDKDIWVSGFVAAVEYIKSQVEDI
jgi:hypothetical protein